MVSSMLDNHAIEPAKGPWSSPIVLVKKKDGFSRLCADFLPPWMLTQIHRLVMLWMHYRWSLLFSMIDLASGYWQLEVAPEDKTPFGFFSISGDACWAMLCNAPSTFKCLMELVFTGDHCFILL